MPYDNINLSDDKDGSDSSESSEDGNNKFQIDENSDEDDKIGYNSRTPIVI